MPETIISIDIETDGPIPIINSMRSLGAVAYDATLLEQCGIVNARDNHQHRYRDRRTHPHHQFDALVGRGCLRRHLTGAMWNSKCPRQSSASISRPTDPSPSSIRCARWARLPTTPPYWSNVE